MARGIKTGGRKRGTPNKRTTELQREAARTGLLPLEVILQTMRYHHKRAVLAVQRKDTVKAERHYSLASQTAAQAAPYLHSKLSSIEVGGSGGQPLIVQIEGKAALL